MLNHNIHEISDLCKAGFRLEIPLPGLKSLLLKTKRPVRDGPFCRIIFILFNLSTASAL
jgi:hypothetical protein